MTNKPFPITDNEIKELASAQALQEAWGAQDVEDMERWLRDVYVVKFDFMNESPGYAGDLFLIQPGCLSDEIPVTRIIRGHDGKLKLLE